ncbi:MAG: hypothetical protein DWQ37_18480 [Planctomycetota bacterium]|nr:MAG: hypothetical protein DWQ37_18480 [Planctomycetota bacterium]
MILATALAATTADFDVRTLDGQSASGRLTSLDAGGLVLETADGPRTFALADLATVNPQTPAGTRRDAALWVELVDDTGLAADEYTVKSGKASIRSPLGETELPAAGVRWVRFGAPERYDPKLTEQWREIVASQPASDLLVVRREEALDYLEGVLRDIDAETCQFELDDEVIPVKRSKIAGLVYAHPQQRALPESVGMLVAADGSRLPILEARLVDDTLKLTTPVGASFEVPLERIARLDFSSGKLAYLSDLEPEKVEFTPLVGFAEPSDALLDFYHYRRDKGFAGQPLRLEGKVFKKGLSLISRTQLVYRLPDDYRLFRATAGIDDATRETGSVQLVIKGDGKTLWESEVRGVDPPHKLELPVEGVKRLEILADYGESLDVGDRLDLGDAHVTK